MQEIADGHGTGRAGTCISKGVPIIEPHAKLFSSLLSLRVLAETLPTNPPLLDMRGAGKNCGAVQIMSMRGTKKRTRAIGTVSALELNALTAACYPNLFVVQGDCRCPWSEQARAFPTESYGLLVVILESTSGTSADVPAFVYHFRSPCRAHNDMMPA